MGKERLTRKVHGAKEDGKRRRGKAQKNVDGRNEKGMRGKRRKMRGRKEYVQTEKCGNK